MNTISEVTVVRSYVERLFSVAQISQKLCIPHWKVRYILKKNKVVMRSISEAVTNVYITRFGKKIFRLKQALSRLDDDLKLTGIMLYWGEGAKTGGTLKFANSDPDMIRVFMLFLRNVCGVAEERIKILVHIYPDHDWESLKQFWMLVTKIRAENFYKPQRLKGKKGSYKNKSIYGTATVHYADKKLVKLVLGWIDEHKEYFLKAVPE